jgi:hypothetical protein
MKSHRVVRNATRNVGDPCSKYGYDRNGEQFNADIQAHEERGQFLWDEFVKFMKSHDVDPRCFRELFIRYHDEFLEGGDQK